MAKRRRWHGCGPPWLRPSQSLAVFVKHATPPGASPSTRQPPISGSALAPGDAIVESGPGTGKARSIALIWSGLPQRPRVHRPLHRGANADSAKDLVVVCRAHRRHRTGRWVVRPKRRSTPSVPGPSSRRAAHEVVPLEPGPIHVIRPERGEDIVDAMTAYSDEHHIRTAWFTHLGAVSAASLRYYDQTKLVYRDFTVDRHLECSGVGNVSLLDGVPIRPLHAAFGDEDGTALRWSPQLRCTVFSPRSAPAGTDGDPLERLPHAESGAQGVRRLKSR